MAKPDDEFDDHVSMVTLMGGPHDGLSVPVNDASDKLGRMAAMVGDRLVGSYVRQPDDAWVWAAEAN